MVSTESFTWEQLQDKATFASRKSVLELSVAMSEHVPGHIMEFCVANGGSTRVLRSASARSKKQVFACDSFEGLQEKYENCKIGEFACEPPKIPGVEIVKGFFDRSLTRSWQPVSAASLSPRSMRIFIPPPCAP
jgi:hypothetical protein